MLKCFLIKIKPKFNCLKSVNYSTSIANILSSSKIGDQIEINGWIKSLRKQKENIFIDLTDGSCSDKLQIFILQSLKPNNITTGSSIYACGHLQSSPNGHIELVAEKIKIYKNCVITEGYPFAPRKIYNNDYIRQYPQFRSRTNKFSSLLRLRNDCNYFIHNYFKDKQFINVNTPILTSNDCEGAGEIFRVTPDNKKLLLENDTLEYFNRKTFLTVSGQLHLEAITHGLSKVYTFGPTFRAENSKSRLHLSEFYMLEVEIAFIKTLNEIIDIIEDFIKYLTNNLLENSIKDLNNFLDVNTKIQWLHKKFPIITYSDALNMCDGNLNSKEDELNLVKKFDNGPVFVINWPKKLKPFYMKECEDNSDNVAALDLLVPIVGELAGGSLREDSYEKLKNKLPQTSLNWYLDLRKFGGVPTGGFGLGFERYLQFILGINNIKDTIPFPRWPHNCNL